MSKRKPYHLNTSVLIALCIGAGAAIGAASGEMAGWLGIGAGLGIGIGLARCIKPLPMKKEEDV